MKTKLAMTLILLSFFISGCKSNGSPSEITVMTRNLYLGANAFRILGIENPLEIPTAIGQIVQTIQATNFNARAQALAKEIDRVQPDLIGLQEVSLFRIQSPGDSTGQSPTPATDPYLDYLKILMTKLENLGLDYEIVSSIENFDQEFPMLASDDNGGTRIDDIRLTDRDVILKRSDIQTRDVQEVFFQAKIEIPFVGGSTISIPRSFSSVIATVHGRDYRFVNTHLETNENTPSEMIQALQALEMIEILGHEPLPVVLVGDINSPPESSAIQPYHRLATAGFVDAWSKKFANNLGHTCCQSETLNNRESELDTRIDHIWVRLPYPNWRVNVVKIGLLGANSEDMVRELWPSDHAGVFATLRIP